MSTKYKTRILVTCIEKWHEQPDRWRLGESGNASTNLDDYYDTLIKI